MLRRSVRNGFALLAIGAVALANGACSSPNTPTSLTASIVTASSTGQPFSAGVNGSAVTIRGNIVTPDPCRIIAATAQADDDNIEVTVRVTANPAIACIAVLGQFDYTVTLPSVPAGKRTLKLKHHIDDQPPVTAFSTSLDVR
jgi:hypothetical protein